MAQGQNQAKIEELENQFSIQFPSNYVSFLEDIEDGQVFEINGSGKYLYGPTDLAERNTTYEIQQYEPDYFLIGQDGDLGFFIKRTENDESIYSNDLGAIGSLEMEKEADNISEFIKN